LRRGSPPLETAVKNEKRTARGVDSLASVEDQGDRDRESFRSTVATGVETEGAVLRCDELKAMLIYSMSVSAGGFTDARARSGSAEDWPAGT
jgi:hypothetical protein